MNDMHTATFQGYNLSFNEEDIDKYIIFFRSKGISVLKVHNLNGDVHLFLSDNTKDKVFIRFVVEGAAYEALEKFHLVSSKMILAFSDSIIKFKANSIIMHHHENKNMIFEYKKGITEKISEKTMNKENVIYQFPPLRKMHDLKPVFSYDEISNKINDLLDQRLTACSTDQFCEIDCELQWLTDEWKKFQYIKKHNSN